MWDDLLGRSATSVDYRSLRGRTLILLGRYDEALEAAEALAGRPDDGGKSAYDAACVLAFNLRLPRQDPLAAARIPAEQTSSLADRAIRLLTLAAQRGYIIGEQLRSDRDLDALRDRSDFLGLFDLLLDRGFPADPFAADGP
jgi:hypothetical protein